MHKLDELKKITKRLDILYVEDDKDSRDELSDILLMLFSTLTVAENGLEGWEAYKKKEFDLVITDINMPIMDGLELSQKIKNMNPNQKIVIVSANGNGDKLLSAIRIGVDNFIVKPVEMEQFNEVIHKVATNIHNQNLQMFYQEELEREVENKTKELIKQSVTDNMTGLYNRSKLNHMFNLNGSKILMLLNIDNFDNLNIAYGYDNGDIIIQKIALFLTKNLHPDATLFRLGSDEFIFLFNKTPLYEAEEYARKLQAMISKESIEIQEIVVKFTATIALAEGENDLLKDVHVAFNEVRLMGKNRIGIYKSNSTYELNQKRMQERIRTLKEALLMQQIVPFYQAIINNETNQIEKYECLVRIVTDKEIIYPSEFLQTAKITGMIPDITKIIIEKSFEYFKDRGEEFSINITEDDLQNNYLDEFLEKNIAKYGIHPSRVVLEVLEGISTNGAKVSYEQLKGLKQRGFQLAIDDFGTEHSNFERVHNLKVDYIKIDGSFIKNMDTNINSYRIVKTITDFSKSIGAKVIAEFIHNEAVQKKVLELGIEYSQGYYFSEPLANV